MARIDEKVGRNIRALRLRSGMSQLEVADAAGVSVSYISMLERGLRSAPLPTLASLGRALHIDPVRLLR
jgi:transcriptional regulator with XRE-family HTH domain